MGKTFMGADNWAICPRCLKAATKEHEAKKKKAEDSYGKVSADKYLALLEASKGEPELDSTLREDYELGVCTDGNFYVIYKGACDKCTFKFEYRYEEDTKP